MLYLWCLAMDKDYSYLNSTYAREKLIEEYNTKYIPMEDSMKDLSNEDIVVMLMSEQWLCGKNDLSQESKYKSELLSHLSAGEAAVKKVAELEKEIKEWENSRDGFLLSSQAKNFKIMELEKEAKRKADLFVKKCFECDEFERQASAG